LDFLIGPSRAATKDTGKAVQIERFKLSTGVEGEAHCQPGAGSYCGQSLSLVSFYQGRGPAESNSWAYSGGNEYWIMKGPRKCRRYIIEGAERRKGIRKAILRRARKMLRTHGEEEEKRVVR
jgi:hypothetical protein